MSFPALAFVTLAAQVPLPGTSSVSVFFQDPEVCRGCHGGFDPDHAAYDTWIGSPMAHAAKDPLFLSALEEAEKDVPGVGDLCIRCHAPAAWLEGRCFPTDGSALTDTDRGITCSACHRMEPSPYQRNGQYIVADDINMRGPLTDPQAPHRVQPSDWFDDARMCGTCHDLRNPLVERVDPDGTPMNMPFPEQTTYTEWEQSAYALENETCQDCHMPEGERRVAEMGPVRPDQSAHDLVGGNAFLLGAIAFLEPGLGRGVELARGQARANAMLRTAADLELLDPPTTVDRGAIVSLTFRTTNLSGHKLPTGYPEGRRVWLEVVSPELSIERGLFDTVDGEPVDPVVTYESIQGRFGVGPGHRLALNDTIFFDNRIPPRGMIVTATIAPVGYDYPEVLPGVLQHWDDVTVTATVPCDLTTDTISIEARLWYQAVTKAYVDALVEENGAHPRGATLQAAFEEADPGPAEMQRVEATLTVRTDSTCATPDAGVPDAGAPDSGDDPPDAGTVPDAGMPDPEDEGCGCTTNRGSSPAADGLLVIALLCLLLRRCPNRRRF